MSEYSDGKGKVFYSGYAGGYAIISRKEVRLMEYVYIMMFIIALIALILSIKK